MNTDRVKISHGPITTVPALPGYRVALLWHKAETDDDEKVPNDAQPQDVVSTFFDVIAWVVRPMIKHIPGHEDICETHVYAVTVDGLLEQPNAYIVSPSGQWTKQYDTTYDDELGAKQQYIDIRRKPADK